MCEHNARREMGGGGIRHSLDSLAIISVNLKLLHEYDTVMKSLIIKKEKSK